MSCHALARAGRLLLACTALMVTTVVSGQVASASAADGCRGSAVREATNTLVTAEPVVANSAGSPCVTESADLTQTTLPLGLEVTDASAATRRAPGLLAASSALVGASLASPVPIAVGPISASQTRSCVNGQTVAGGASSVTSLTVGGQPVVIPSGRTVDLNLGLVRVRTNQLAGDTRRALVLDVAGEQIVLGEASASGDACAVADTGPGAPGGPGGGDGSGTPSTGLCPVGASYDAGADRCVIVLDGRTVVVSAPFEGPEGGRVLALVTARELADRGELPRSRCLSGSGPEYVVVGSAGRDRIRGTAKRDRILGLGGRDRIDGGRGRDCLDGGRGADRLYGGTGSDRTYGGKGRDRQFGQAGNDLLAGGAGRDRLYGASGRDRNVGANGNDRIVTGSGRDTVRAGRGRDYVNAVAADRRTSIDMQRGRDRVFIRRAQAARVRNAEVVHYVR